MPGFVPQIDGVAMTPAWLGERFMQAVVAAVQARFPEEQDWVITVPVDSFEAYRTWLAGTLPQLERLQIIDEPTAAALGWAEAEATTWLLIDLGGGTLDVVLVELDAAVQKGGPLGTILRWGQAQLRQTAGHQARVLAKTAQTLGGADFDQWLAEWWCDREPESGAYRRSGGRSGSGQDCPIECCHRRVRGDADTPC
ncbi:MAG: Hsp70 family protein [Synechococcaceae cyanobacterium SM2_3_60]|nr:Hsp70 family protein [Synechococcaceae cyanobacterium SM2_3_60]